MPLLIKRGSRGQVYVAGQKDSFLKYEKALQIGKISCGLQVMFKDSRHCQRGRNCWEMLDSGKVVHIGQMPLTLTGKAKTPLFLEENSDAQ